MQYDYRQDASIFQQASMAFWWRHGLWSGLVVELGSTILTSNNSSLQSLLFLIKASNPFVQQGNIFLVNIKKSQSPSSMGAWIVHHLSRWHPFFIPIVIHNSKKKRLKSWWGRCWLGLCNKALVFSLSLILLTRKRDGRVMYGLLCFKPIILPNKFPVLVMDEWLDEFYGATIFRKIKQVKILPDLAKGRGCA